MDNGLMKSPNQHVLVIGMGGTIAGLAESHDKLTEVAAILKKKCGCGGSVKDGIIEIQGDQREVVSAELTRLGYGLKWAGG